MAGRKQVLFYFILFCCIAIIGSGVYVYQSGVRSFCAFFRLISLTIFYLTFLRCISFPINR
jgi:hypothetical protein